MDRSVLPPDASLVGLRRRAAAIRVDPPFATEVSVGYRVTSAEGAGMTWRVVVNGETVSVDDRIELADVTMSCDIDTATALFSNGLSVQRAVLDGRLTLGGDLAILVDHPRLAAVIADVTRDA